MMLSGLKAAKYDNCSRLAALAANRWQPVTNWGHRWSGGERVHVRYASPEFGGYVGGAVPSDFFTSIFGGQAVGRAWRL
jgi:hypothetical protein